MITLSVITFSGFPYRFKLKNFNFQGCFPLHCTLFNRGTFQCIYFTLHPVRWLLFLHCNCPMFILNILLFRNSAYYGLMFLMCIAHCKGPKISLDVLQKLIFFLNVRKLTLQRSHVHIKCFNLQKGILLLHLNVFKLTFHGMITFSTLKMITLNVLLYRNSGNLTLENSFWFVLAGFLQRSATAVQPKVIWIDVQAKIIQIEMWGKDW